MTRKTYLIGILCLIFVFLPLISFGASYKIPPLPDFPVPDWPAGSSVTYDLKLDQGEIITKAKFRMAVLGTEKETSTNLTLYWIELDFFDISGIHPQDQQFFLDFYGEMPNALRVNVLIPKYDFNLIFNNPSKVYQDFSEAGFIRKCYFQYNRQVPYDIPPSVVSGLIMPLIITNLAGPNLPDEFYETRNIGIKFIKNTDDYKTETSKSEIKTNAGFFEGTMFAFTAKNDNDPSGKIMFSSAVPILPFVLFEGAWLSNRGIISAEIVLSDIETSGSKSQIVGTPEVFNPFGLSTKPGT